MHFYDRLRETLEGLRRGACLRALPSTPKGLVNLSSNDYLGLLEDEALRESFYAQLHGEARLLSAASSRLLTGSTEEARLLETELARAYGTEAALVFGSGYHANTGILQAVAGPKTLVLADKLIHASMIDGIRLAGCDYVRFRHNDLGHARVLLERRAADYDEVMLMTESVFSMDGDRTDLKALTALKADFPNLILYLDEAHGVGVFGPNGLGCAEAEDVLGDIDILVGTLGKALSSTGAYVVCRADLRDILVNRMRPFIFTTALPPVNLAWTRFVLAALPAMAARRERLQSMGRRLADTVRAKGVPCASASQIVPWLVGPNDAAVAAAAAFRSAGFYVLPIRPPTVPEGTARLRFSLTAALTEADFGRLLEVLEAQ